MQSMTYEFVVQSMTYVSVMRSMTYEFVMQSMTYESVMRSMAYMLFRYENPTLWSVCVLWPKNASDGAFPTAAPNCSMHSSRRKTTTGACATT